jgi:YVTN family beta-propeller protein
MKVFYPIEFGFGFGSIWVPNHHGNSLVRIDAATNQVIATIQGVADGAHDTAVTNDSVWVTGVSITRIDPKTNTVVATLPGDSGWIDYGFNSIWATTWSAELLRIDPATNKIIANIRLPCNVDDCANDLRAVGGAVWVFDRNVNQLVRVDPATNAVISKTPYADLVSQAQAQTQVPAGKGTNFMWWLVPAGLLRLDPQTGAPLTFLPLDRDQMGDGGNGMLAVTDDALWINGRRQIERFNVATNKIDATYSTDSGENVLGYGYGSVWLAYYGLNLVERLENMSAN